jgi:hypothetical protein
VPETDLPQFDTSVANTARIWNYWLGGKDNFAADREAAERVMQAMPALPVMARLVRRFLVSAVHQLATEYGIRQFLDIGAGLPAADNTHEVAQRALPAARIVYVDYDPVVISHSRALLISSQEGTTDYVHADLRDTSRILTETARTLDFGQPVAILLISVLHFIPWAEDPFAVVSRLMGAVPSGSYLALVHAASDIAAEGEPEARQRYNQMTSVQFTPRSHGEVARFFGGLDMTGPGLVPISHWGVGADKPAASLAAYCGIGRKP